MTAPTGELRYEGGVLDGVLWIGHLGIPPASLARLRQEVDEELRRREREARPPHPAGPGEQGRML